MSSALLVLGYVVAAATVAFALFLLQAWVRMRGRHFGAAAAVPLVLGLLLLGAWSVLGIGAHLGLGWRWPLQSLAGVVVCGAVVIRGIYAGWFRR